MRSSLMSDDRWRGSESRIRYAIYTLEFMSIMLFLFISMSVHAGGPPTATVLDILSDAQPENMERVTILSNVEVHYTIDDTDLNNTQSPQLLVEIQNASLDKSLGSGLGTSVTVKRNGLLRIEAIESPQTRRVYVYIELSEPRSYRELSASPTRRITLEIEPASGKASSLPTTERTTQSSRSPTARKVLLTGDRSQQSGPNRSVDESTRGQTSRYPTVQPTVRLSADDSTRVSSSEPYTESSSTVQTRGLAHVKNLVYKLIDPDKLHITVELDQPVEPEITRTSQGIQMAFANTLLAFRSTEGGGWIREQTLDVQQDAIKQIQIRQESIDPEQVVIIVVQEYPTEYHLLPPPQPNRILLEVDTQKRQTRADLSDRLTEFPRGRIDGNTIILPVGQSLTLDMTLAPGDTVTIGDPSIADAVPNTANSLIVNGQQRGLTSLEIRDQYNRLVTHYGVQVYEDWSWIEQEIESELGERIDVRVRNGAVFLEGSVETTEQAQQAEQIARAMIADRGAVYSTLAVRSESNEGITQRLKTLLDAEGLQAVDVNVQSDRIILSGSVANHADLQRAENIARFFGSNVLNNIEVRLPDTLAAEIESELALPNVKVQVANDGAILRGVVRTAEEKSRVEQIAALYVPRVTNLVEIKAAHPSAEEIQAFIGLPNITVRWSDDIILLGGTAESQLESSMAEQIAKRFASSVVNNIRVNRQDQVNIKVRVIEVNKNATSRLGIDWTNSVRFQEEFIPRGKLSELYKLGRAVRLDPITSTINALIQEGNAKVLVDANLTTISGKMAELHSGGELPLVSSITNGQGFGTIFGQDVRAFGVRLQITPTVDEQEYITVALTPEVSSINESESVMTPMGLVPTFNVRKLDATVRVQSGETFAIGGVMQQQESVTKSKIPLLGHIPILGALFTTTIKASRETELVFILTPVLVNTGMENPSMTIPESPFPEKTSAFVEPQTPPATMSLQSFVPSPSQQATEKEPFEW